jgi:hypothetical protein
MTMSEPIDLRGRGFTVASKDMEVSNDCVTWALARAGTDLTAYRWMRFPAVPRESTIEQRRAALRVGDVITDPALLCEGMEVQATPGRRLVLGPPTDGGFATASGSLGGLWAGFARTGRVTFLGYADKPAPEVKGAEVKKVTVDEVDGMAKKLEAFYAQAGIPQQYSAANWGATPTPPAKALPFKRHKNCGADHSQPVMCLQCESMFMSKMDARDSDAAYERSLAHSVTREKYEPQCGAFVGRVLTPVRR